MVWLSLFYLLFAVAVIWLAVFAICEAYSLWSWNRYYIRFRLHTLVIIVTAACLTTAIVSGERVPMLKTLFYVSILYLPVLGACVFVDMLARDAWQAFQGSRGKAMAAYRDKEGVLELDEQGEPLIGQRDSTESMTRPPRRQRTKITIVGVRYIYGRDRD